MDAALLVYNINITNILILLLLDAEAGAGPGVVEGGCQPVLACRCF